MTQHPSSKPWAIALFLLTLGLLGALYLLAYGPPARWSHPRVLYTPPSR